MTDPTDAPKIDTTAPERIWAVRTGIEGAVELGAWADTVRYHGGGDEYILASVAAAQTAAAVQEMRERAAEVLRSEAEACREIKTSFRQSDASLATVGNWLDDYSKQIRALPPPADGQAALDRLIAEARREALEAEREACAQIARERWFHPEAEISSSHIADAIRARGSKEGRDG